MRLLSIYLAKLCLRCSAQLFIIGQNLIESEEKRRARP